MGAPFAPKLHFILIQPFRWAYTREQNILLAAMVVLPLHILFLPLLLLLLHSYSYSYAWACEV